MKKIAQYLKMPSNRYFDAKEILEILIFSIPCVSLSIYYKDTGWLTIGLISTSLYLTLIKLRWGCIGVLFHWVLILASISVLFFSLPYPWIFAIMTAILCGGCIYVSCHSRALRSLGSWVIIPAVYIACELNVSGEMDSFHKLIFSSPVGLFSPLILALTRNYSEKGTSFISCTENTKVLARKIAFSVVVAVFIVALWVDYFPIYHGEWMIWSIVSVSTGELQSMYQKFGNRLKGGIIGCAIGICLLQFQQSMSIAPIFGFLIPITLVIRNYPLSFACRCMLIVLSSGSIEHGETTALYRLLSVIVGGIIGVAICSSLLKVISVSSRTS